MSLRIGIDARMVGPVMAGLGRYARGLVRHLPPLDPHNQYVVIRRAVAPAPIATAPNVEDAVVDAEPDRPANLLAARAINCLQLDLYHSLYDFVPPGLRVPRVVLTLHDVLWLEHPDLCFDERFAWVKARATNLYARATMPYAARRATRVIAVSAHTGERGTALLGLDPARVHVVHHGVDREEFPPGPDRRLRSEARGQAPSEPFFLCLGNTKPYKNPRVAIVALAHLVAEGRRCRLVICGRGDSRPRLEGLARELRLEDRVVFTGPVAHERLLELLHGAVALVFPSLVEGFGLPLIESMSAGCPVIGSSVPPFAEVCGDAALLPDPSSPTQVGGAMRRLLDDEPFRQELRARGFRRASLFDWRTCAKRTLAIYRSVLMESS